MELCGPPAKVVHAARFCSQSERNRTGLSIVETMVVVEWCPGGGTVDFGSCGRSVPPRNDFDQKRRRFGPLANRIQAGSQPALLSPLSDVVDSPE
jgi:hypothetical protein